MVDQVKICGIPYKVILKEDEFDTDAHFGQIDYVKSEIKINAALSNEMKEEALTHEILHGIFIHLGFNDESQNERFVQSLANAINQTFTLRKEV